MIDLDDYPFPRVTRLLGVRKPYMTWALYALTCEALGQPMMYPDRFPPGAAAPAPPAPPPSASRP